MSMWQTRKQWVRWKTEQSFRYQMCPEHRYQKYQKLYNSSSSYKELDRDYNSVNYYASANM